ncbi:MAG: class I SAM-dependent methyltransferase [Bacteroidota bacterium]
MKSGEPNEKKDWFEDWFDSPLYELIYADRNQGEAERLADLIRELIPPATWSHVLDLGCGRGRHSLSLARRGYDVTGLDLSEASIQIARKRAADQGVKGIRFIVGDMREPFPETVDAVVNLFTSFGYFETDRENEQVLRNIHGMLRPGGRVLIDFLNAIRVRTTYVPEEKGEYEGIRFTIRRYEKDQAVHKEIHFRGSEPGQTRSYKERVKLYGLPWFRDGLASAGLRLIETFGDYEGTPFEPDQSPRLIMLAERL